jgi:5-methylcytosine-specific restriction endonuclease McrA
MPDSVFKLNADGNPVFLKITSAIFKRTVAFSTQLEVVDAVNLMTGESCCVVVDTVLKNALRESYPADGYVDRTFQIMKFAPAVGKRYATFDVKEIRVRTDGLASATSKTANESGGLDRVQAADYADYLKSPLWRTIRRRVLKRDGNVCRRCGGKATRVHHRSYADEVMAGNDDRQLASICEGCHNVIHFDDNGQKCSPEETERLLCTRDESATFPVPEVDLRLRRRKDPPGWDRMSAVQRQAWHCEHERLRWLHWVRVGKSPDAARKRLQLHDGMTDEQINTEVAALRKQMSKRRNRS